jgi:hypothetical protein
MQNYQNSKDTLAKPSRVEVAIKFHVEDLDSGIVPGSRLSNILERLELGRPLSSYSWTKRIHRDR